MKKPIMMKPEVFDALKQIQQMNIKSSLYGVVWKNEKAFQDMGVSLDDITDVLSMKENAEDFPNANFYQVYDHGREHYIYANFMNPDIKLRGDNERAFLAAVRSRDSWRIDYEQKAEYLSKTVSKGFEKLLARQEMLEREGWGSLEAIKYQVSKTVDKMSALLWKKNEPMTVEMSSLREGMMGNGTYEEQGLGESMVGDVEQPVMQEPEKIVDRDVMADNYKIWTLTDEQKLASDGVTVLHRIQATKDFSYVYGVDVVKGELGGWIESENNLEGNSWVGDHGEVYGRAKVVDSAVVESAIVKDDARVAHDSCVRGNAQIMGSSYIENSIITDNAHIDDFAVIEKSAVDGYSSVSGESYIRDCTCSGNAHIVSSIIQNVDMSGDIYIEACEYSYGKGEDERDYVNYRSPALLEDRLVEKLRACQKDGLKKEIVCSGEGMEFIADLDLVYGQYVRMDLAVSHPVIRCNGKCYDGQKLLDKLEELRYPIGEIYPECLMDMLAGKPQSLGPYVCVIKQDGDEFILEDVTNKMAATNEQTHEKSKPMDLQNDENHEQAETVAEGERNTVGGLRQSAGKYATDAKMKSLFVFSGEEKLASDGVTLLHQIQANRDLSFLGEKDIPEGTLGGWIENERNLSGYSWVDGDSEVFGNARVVNSFVLGSSIVRDNAVVKESTVWENSLIEGDAEIERSLVSGHVRIGGSSVLENSVFAGYGVINGNSHLDGCFCRKNVNVIDSWLRYVCMEGDFTINEKQLDCTTEGDKMMRYGYNPPVLLAEAVLEELRAHPEGLKGIRLCEVDGKEFVGDLNLVAGEDMRMRLVVSNPVVRCDGVNYNSQKVIDGLAKLNRNIAGISPDRLARMMTGEPLPVRSVLYAIGQKGNEYELTDLRKRVNNIEIYSLKDGGMSIRCTIDGVQQGGKRLSEEAVLAFNDRTDRRALAVDYFMDELREKREVELAIRR